MTKKEKLLKKILEIPPRSDLTFKDLQVVLEGFGYKLIEGSGSRVKFFHPETKDLFLLHKPHPSPILKKYLIKQLQEKIKTIQL
jgi:predicted RNA binding protein YcfA (HicA-like mRNA interferase family)